MSSRSSSTAACPDPRKTTASFPGGTGRARASGPRSFSGRRTPRRPQTGRPPPSPTRRSRIDSPSPPCRSRLPALPINARGRISSSVVEFPFLCQTLEGFLARRQSLDLSLLARLQVVLALLEFGKHARLLALSLEAPQRVLE